MFHLGMGWLGQVFISQTGWWFSPLWLDCDTGGEHLERLSTCCAGLEPSDLGQSPYPLLCREQASLLGFPKSRLTSKAHPTLLGQWAASTVTGFLVISNKSLGSVLAAHLQGSAAGAEVLVILVLLVFSHPLF